MNKKTLIIGVVCCLVIVSAVSVVVAYSTTWSEPTREDGTPIQWTEANTEPVKGICPIEEWNDMFEDYREGLVSKEDMKEYLRYCK